jgi:hypothetical protein
MNESDLDILKEAANVIKLDLDAMGGCDHSVGLCSCYEFRTLDDLNKLIERLAKELATPDFLSEALNSGDGVYRP